MSAIRVETVTGPTPGDVWVEFEDGAVVDASDPAVAAVVDSVTGQRWSPAVEYEPAVLDHSNGALCLLAVQRASQLDPVVPSTRWRVLVDGEPYVPAPGDELEPIPQD
jgi:hypothetical protein